MTPAEKLIWISLDDDPVEILTEEPNAFYAKYFRKYYS